MPVGSVPRPSWRYLWFGVRVLISLVLVLGIWLVWIVHLAQVQREAVAAIEKDGGTVLYDWEWNNGHSVPGGQPRAPRWLVAQVGVDFFGHVTAVKSRSPSLAQVGRLTGLQTLHVISLPLPDARLKYLKSFTNLSSIELGRTDELKHLKGLTHLSELDLSGTQVTDAGLVHLEGLTNLSTLSLDGARVGSGGLVYLRGLTKLSALNLNHTRVSDAGLTHLKGLTNLSTLSLDGAQVSGAGLVDLVGLANLSTLSLGSTPVGDAELEHLKGLTHLSELDLRGTQVSDAGAKELRRALPGLKLVLR